MMNTKNMILDIRRTLGRTALTTGLILGLGSGLTLADTEVEYEATEGYHQEEWYDPSDWFNEDGDLSYESDSDWTGSAWYDTYDPMVTSYYFWDPIDAAWANDEDVRTAGNPQDERDRRTTTFEGKIDGFRDVDISDHRGVEERHSFVKVTLKDGKSRVISLGSKMSPDELNLEKGDKIRVSGQPVKVDERKILLADRIKTDGETFNIRSERQPELSRKDNRPERNMKSDRDREVITRVGTLRDFAKADLGGKRGENLVVRLEMNDGRSVVADLGTGTTLADLDLEKGDKVYVNGHTRQLDGKTLLVAKKLRVDGDAAGIRDKKSRNSNSDTSRKSY